MSSALVSVVIPAYNTGPYLAATLDSVFAQTHKAVEIIVVDDASTDNTQDVLQAYRDRLQVIRLEKNAGGPAKPRNIGMQAAKGEYIAMFDSDDLMVADGLEKKVAYLRNHADVPFVFANFANLYEDGEEVDFLQDHSKFWDCPKSGDDGFRIRSQDAYDTLAEDNFIGTSGIVFRRDLVEKIGGFDESLVNSDDYDFFLKVANEYDIGYLDEILHKRRIHRVNISSREKAAIEQIKVKKKWYQLSRSQSVKNKFRNGIAALYFALGHRNKVEKNRRRAFKFYLQCWQYKKSFRLVLSMMRLLLPV